VTLGLSEPLFVTIPRGRYDDLEAQVQIEPQLSAPLPAGQVVGAINVELGDEVVASRELVTLSAIDEAGFFGRSWDSLKLWMDGLFDDDE
jgi:D-alanyl-D-alanine carboxypeptidase (penicillin-binding protein 5/6)